MTDRTPKRAFPLMQAGPGLRASADQSGMHLEIDDELAPFWAQITAMTIVDGVPTYSWAQADYNDLGALIQLADGLIGDTTANPAYEANASDTVPIGAWVWLRPGYLAGTGDAAPTDRAYLFDQTLGAGTNVQGEWVFNNETGITWIGSPIVPGGGSSGGDTDITIIVWTPITIVFPRPYTFWWDPTINRPVYYDGTDEWVVGLQVTNESGLVANGVGSINLLDQTGGLTFSIDPSDSTIVDFKQVPYKGCTNIAAGIIGGVPPAIATQQKYLLCGDATWEPFTVNAEAVNVVPNSSTSPTLYIAFDDNYFTSSQSLVVPGKAMVSLDIQTAATAVNPVAGGGSINFNALAFDENYFLVHKETGNPLQADVQLALAVQLAVNNPNNAGPTTVAPWNTISFDAVFFTVREETGNPLQADVTLNGLTVSAQPLVVKPNSVTSPTLTMDFDQKFFTVWQDLTVSTQANISFGTWTDGEIPIGKTGTIPTLTIISQDAKMDNAGKVTVQGIQTQPIKNATATDGQSLLYNGTNSDWEATSFSGDVVVAGDGDTTVTGLQGRTVSNSAPTSGNVLAWSGTQWAPAAGGGGTLTNTHILVGNASNVPADVAMTGDASIINTGAIKVTGLYANPFDPTTMASPGTNYVISFNGSHWFSGTVSSLLDSVFSNSQGAILYRGSSGWAALAPSTAGYLLTTNGSGANPTWTAGGGGGGSSPTWTKYTFSYTDLKTSSPANINTITLTTLPRQTVLHMIMLKLSTAFTAGNVTTLTVAVEDDATSTVFGDSYQIMNSASPPTVSDTNYDLQTLEDSADLANGFTGFGTRQLDIHETAGSSDDLSTLTAGQLDVWLLTSTLP